MYRPTPIALLLGVSLAGCQQAAMRPPSAARPSVVLEEPEAWRQTATPAGIAAVEALDSGWGAALAEIRRRGGTRAIDAEEPLLDPAAALPRAAPAPGAYRCRVLRLGAAGGRTRGLSVSRSAFCFVGVEGDQLSLTTEVPGHRLGGYLYDTPSSARLIFLGASAPARGRAPGYGENLPLDKAGRFERVDDFRYRLILPGAAAPEVHIFELIAAPPVS
jgi:hypothetical protein